MEITQTFRTFKPHFQPSLRLAIGLAVTGVLTGCVLSPYNAEKFESVLDEVTFMVVTPNKVDAIKVRCQEATSTGTPVAGSQRGLIAEFLPAPQEYEDSSGRTVFIAQTQLRISDTCWSYKPSAAAAGYQMVTALTFEQGRAGQTIYTYDEDGKECLIDSIGLWTDDVSWIRGINNGCYRGTSLNPERTIHIRAKAPPPVSLCAHYSKYEVIKSSINTVPGVTVGSIVRDSTTGTDVPNSCFSNTYLARDTNGNFLGRFAQIFTYQQNRERRDCALFFDECSTFNAANQETWNF